MSYNYNQRQQVINENLPKLVKLLSGFNEDDENFKLCENYAFSRITNHRFLSVNSHEVRRRIDGVAERFMADNYTQHGERFKKLVQQFVTDPICTNHEEYDIQWSVLHFLLEVSKNPVAALSEDKNSIRIEESVLDDSTHPDRRRSSAMRDLVKSLIQHNIPTAQPRPLDGVSYEESDLSDWSDEEDEAAESSVPKAHPQTENGMPLRLKLLPFSKSALKPPERKSIFTLFDGATTLEWREKYIQSAWWLEPPTSVISEWCLLREIFWTLQLNPIQSEDETHKQIAKCFSIDLNTDTVLVNDGCTLSSTTTGGLKPILSDFALIATKLYRLRKFFQTVFQPPIVNSFLESVQVAPHSIQCYANGLKDHLRIVSHAICELEQELIQQDLTQVRTIVYVYNQLYQHFRTVHMLYDFHHKVYIDFKTNAGHVCVSYLWASLINEMETTALIERLNIAASLLVVSMRYYLSVFNRWWTEGQLNDWHSEFLIKKGVNQNRMSSSSNVYQCRSIADGISRALDTAIIKERIDSCEIITLLRDEALEAGYILNILHNLDKLTEMKGRQSADETQNIEDVFMNTFLEEISQFHIDGAMETEVRVEPLKPAICITAPTGEHASLVNKELSGDADALLSMAFEQFISHSDEDGENCQQQNVKEHAEGANNCYELFKRMSKVSDFPMPFNVIIHECLSKILKSRISVANEYVLRIFLEEYKLLDHIINLQRVFFFGAGDLMLTFYSKLFKSMNAGEDWNNSYLLTVQLDDVLTTRYPEMHSMFSVQIMATDSHIKETLSAITDITINYLVNDSIRDVIHDRALMKYNEIFRFLLQVKWAIWTLETLQFPVGFKKRPPYQQLTLIDLIFKRLALVRNWIIYSVQCVHSHLMTLVIQSMGQQLVKRIKKSECLREIIELHDSYIDTIYQHCFRKTSDIPLKSGLEQLLSLVVILRDEWNNLHNVNSQGDFVDGENTFDVGGTVQQVDVIEATYINCHCHIAEVLTREVYSKDQTTLASLSAAFNCSCPY